MSSTKTAVLIATLVVSPGVADVRDTQTEAREKTTRSVYVSVTDNDGQPVTKLTPSDFRLRENNRDRVVIVHGMRQTHNHGVLDRRPVD